LRQMGGKYVRSGTESWATNSQPLSASIGVRIRKRMKSTPSRVYTATVASRLATEEQALRVAKDDLVVQQKDNAEANGCKHKLLPLAIPVPAEPQVFDHLPQPSPSLRGARLGQNRRKLVRSGTILFQVTNHYRGLRENGKPLTLPL
jgi:hypothetical protein